jgi:hypothetical protein
MMMPNAATAAKLANSWLAAKGQLNTNAHAGKKQNGIG